MIDSTREPDLVRLLADLEGRLYAQERLTSVGEAATVSGPVHITVKNTSGGALTAGTAVYATGSVGASGAVEVGVCDNTNTATMPALGLLDADLANNGEGSATILGIIDQIDTSGWAINDELWVNGAGALTNVRPTSGLIQKIGRVVRVNASTGEVLVLGAGRSNDVPFPLFVDHANQRVGIGTTSPEAELDVSAAVTPQIQLTSEKNGTWVADDPFGEVNFYGSDSSGGGAGYRGRIRSVATDQYGYEGELAFHTTNVGDGDAERVRIAQDGKVGIGTTSPSSRLEVRDSLATLTLASSSTVPTANTELQAIDFYQSDASGGAGVSARIVGSANNSSGAQNIEFHTGQAGAASVAERMRIDSNGKVGIGTTSPGSPLDVVKTGTGSWQRGVRLLNADLTTGDELMYAVGKDDSARNMGQIYFYYQSWGSTSNRMSIGLHSKDDIVNINGLGRVGIGTTSPVEMLTVGSGSNYGSLNVHAWKGADSFAVVENVVKSDNIRLLTTTVSANTYTDATTGVMYRSTTSSARYKTDVETMEDEYADAILGLRPVWYRSVCPGDHESFGYWGFIAEEVAEVDPRLVTFTVPEDYEWQYDDAGQKIAPSPGELTVPEGLQYDRMVPHLVNLVKRQRDELDDLRSRIEALEN